MTSLRTRLAAEGGFTMIIALGVLAVTTLLLGALFIAVGGDAHTSQHDLDSKRAYSAAEAGVNAFLYQLNQNPNYWTSCSNDTLAQTQVPGTSPAEYYSYVAIPANGFTSCTSNTIASLIDTSSGSLRMEFTGYSGTPQVQRTVVASFRKLTPLDFLWYTVYEALDSSINGFTGCGVFYRAGSQQQLQHQLGERRHDERTHVHPGPVPDPRVSDLRTRSGRQDREPGPGDQRQRGVLG